MRDCYHERDTGIGEVDERDLGNHLNEPITGCLLMIIFEESDLLSPRKASAVQVPLHSRAARLVSDTFQLLRGNENSTSSEVADLPKVLNGPQGNVVSDCCVN